MELATDIMAILGWALFGLLAPVLFSYLGGTKESVSTTYDMIMGLISFGLIAASIVLG